MYNDGEAIMNEVVDYTISKNYLCNIGKSDVVYTMEFEKDLEMIPQSVQVKFNGLKGTMYMYEDDTCYADMYRDNRLSLV